jgi:hypothetical protein
MNCMSCWNDKRNNWLTSVISLPRHKASSGTECLLDIEDIWIRSVRLQIISSYAVLVLFLGITLCEVCGSQDVLFRIRLLIVITGIGSLSPLLGVKILHLVDRLDLFKISNLIYDGRKICITRVGVHTSYNNETTLHKWEPLELKHSEFWLLDLLGSSEI